MTNVFNSPTLKPTANSFTVNALSGVAPPNSSLNANGTANVSINNATTGNNNNNNNSNVITTTNNNSGNSNIAGMNPSGFSLVGNNNNTTNNVNVSGTTTTTGGGDRLITIPVKQNTGNTSIKLSTLMNVLPQPQQQQPNLIGSIIKNVGTTNTNKMLSPTFSATQPYQQQKQQPSAYASPTIAPPIVGVTAAAATTTTAVAAQPHMVGPTTVTIVSPTMVPIATGEKASGKGPKKERKTKSKGKSQQHSKDLQQYDEGYLEKLQSRQRQVIKQKLKHEIMPGTPGAQQTSPPKPVTLGADIISTDIGYNISQPSVLGDLGLHTTSIVPPPTLSLSSPTIQPQQSQGPLTLQQQQQQQGHRHKRNKNNGSSNNSGNSSSTGEMMGNNSFNRAQETGMGMSIVEGSSVPTVLVNPSAIASGMVVGGDSSGGGRKEKRSPTIAPAGQRRGEAEDLGERVITPKPIRIFTLADANTQLQAKKRKKREKKPPKEKHREKEDGGERMPTTASRQTQLEQGEAPPSFAAKEEEEGETGRTKKGDKLSTPEESNTSGISVTKLSNTQRTASLQCAGLKRSQTPGKAGKLVFRTSSGLSPSLLLLRRKRKRLLHMHAVAAATASATGSGSGSVGSTPAKKRRKRLTMGTQQTQTQQEQQQKPLSPQPSLSSSSSQLVFKEFESHKERTEQNEVRIVRDRDITPSLEAGEVVEHKPDRSITRATTARTRKHNDNNNVTTKKEGQRKTEATAATTTTVKTEDVEMLPRETVTAKNEEEERAPPDKSEVANEEEEQELGLLAQRPSGISASELGSDSSLTKLTLSSSKIGDIDEIIPEESVPPPTNYYEEFGDDSFDYGNDYDNNDTDKTTTSPSKGSIIERSESIDAWDDGIVVRDYTPNPETDVIEHIVGHRARGGGLSLSSLSSSSSSIATTTTTSTLLVDPEAPGVEFNVKWKGWASIHNTWNTRRQLERFRGYKRVGAYIKGAQAEARRRRAGSAEEIEQLDIQREMAQSLLEDYTKVERVVAVRRVHNAGTYYLVQWKGLPYSDCTWERERDVAGFVAEIAAFRERNERYLRCAAPKPSLSSSSSSSSLSSSSPTTVQFITAGTITADEGRETLRGYQVEGVNWLLKCYQRRANAILADDMGLGKTVETVALVAQLVGRCGVFSPYLVVVPLSTLGGWAAEFKKWAPGVNVVSYVGNATSRAMVRDYEFYGEGARFKLSVVLTTYEIVLKDRPILDQIAWEYVIVDEAHRLKNSESHLYNALIGFKARNRLLITGTPLQSSVRELWSLLHFIAPTTFPTLASFERKYAGLQASDGKLRALHAELGPYILRRLRRDVEHSPGASSSSSSSSSQASELVLRVSPTPLQRMYYRWVITRTFHELNDGVRGEGKVTLLNIVAELKKVCNHPYLFPGAESSAEADVLGALVRNSGKMRLLDALLARLRAAGRRVLIFSQMVRMLDVLSDYLRMKAWPFQRLDGSTSREMRQKAMDHFNAPGSQDFCCLLSTRAGGLGINLAAADAVVIFDSDWNPQNDLQAQARCRRRVDQDRPVTIYRVLIEGTVEENIVRAAKKKLLLDKLAIQSMSEKASAGSKNNSNEGNDSKSEDREQGTQTNNFTDWIIGGMSNSSGEYSKEELDAIIKLGAQGIFDISKDSEMDGNIEKEIDGIMRVIDSKLQSSAASQTSASAAPCSSPNIVDGTVFGLDKDGMSEKVKLTKRRGLSPTLPSTTPGKNSGGGSISISSNSSNDDSGEKFTSFGNDKFWVDLITTNKDLQKEYNKIQALTRKTQASGRLQAHVAGDMTLHTQKETTATVTAAETVALPEKKKSRRETVPTIAIPAGVATAITAPESKQRTEREAKERDRVRDKKPAAPSSSLSSSSSSSTLSKTKENIYGYLIGGLKKFGETFGARMKSHCSSEAEYRRDSEKLAEVVRDCEKNCADKSLVEYHGVKDVRFADIFIAIQMFRILKAIREKGYSLDSIPALDPPTQDDCDGLPPHAMDAWTPECDAMVLKGIYRHGIGYWESIAKDKDLGLQKFSSLFVKKRFQKLAKKLLHTYKRKSQQGTLLSSFSSSSSSSSLSAHSSSQPHLSAPVAKKPKLSRVVRRDNEDDEDEEEDIYEDVTLSNSKTPVPPSISPNLSKTPVPPSVSPDLSRTPVPPSISPNLSKTPLPRGVSPSLSTRSSNSSSSSSNSNSVRSEGSGGSGSGSGGSSHQEKQQEKLMLKQKKRQEFNEAKAKIGNALPDEWNIFWKIPPEGERDSRIADVLAENETKAQCERLLRSVQAEMSKLVYFKIYSCKCKIDFVMSKTIKYIRAIGACIDRVVADGSAAAHHVTESHLWGYVAINTARNSTFLQGLYKRVRSQSTPVEVPNALFKSLNGYIIKDETN